MYMNLFAKKIELCDNFNCIRSNKKYLGFAMVFIKITSNSQIFYFWNNFEYSLTNSSNEHFAFAGEVDGR